MDNSKRKYGIDLLRIIAVVMIVILHCFSQGGLLNNCVSMSKQDWFCVIMSSFTYAGVDIFALISGYLAYNNAKVKYARYFELWLTVVFYCIFVGYILCYIKPEYSFKKNLIIMVTPVSSNSYWYFTAFTGLYIIKPLINKGLVACEEQILKKLFIVIFLFYSVYSMIFDVFGLNRGYSVLWIILLYIMGFIVNKCGIFRKRKTIILLLILGVLVAITIFSDFIIKQTDTVWGHIDRDMLLSYLSPTVLLVSIIMLVLFSRIKLNEKIGKYIKLITMTSFSVYLVNCHPIFFQAILKDMFISYFDKPVLVILFNVLRFSLIFCVFVMVFDILRNKLFKLCRVDKLAEGMENILRKAVGKATILLK